MCEKVVGERKTKSPEQALQSLMALCARAEKSSGDALRLMTSWGVERVAQQEVLAQLRSDRFIDDERFARAYISEKTRLSGWGEYKIRVALHRKGIAKEIIDERLAELDPDATREKLHSMLERRAKRVKYKDRYDLRSKLIRYGASLGYDFERVSQSVNDIIAQIPTEEEEIFF